MDNRSLSLCLIPIEGSSVQIPVHILQLEAEIQADENGVMKSGLWVLLNTLPWVASGLKNNSVEKVFGRILKENAVFGLKSSFMKSNHQFQNIPNGRRNLSFVLHSSFIHVLAHCKFIEFVNNNEHVPENICEKYKLACFQFAMSSSSMVLKFCPSYIRHQL